MKANETKTRKNEKRWSDKGGREKDRSMQEWKRWRKLYIYYTFLFTLLYILEEKKSIYVFRNGLRIFLKLRRREESSACWFSEKGTKNGNKNLWGDEKIRDAYERRLGEEKTRMYELTSKVVQKRKREKACWKEG